MTRGPQLFPKLQQFTSRSLLLSLLLVAASCGTASDDGLDASSSISGGDETAVATSEATDCVVRLHGKGGQGSETVEVDAVAELSPTGNDSAWDGRQWLYFPDDRYEEAKAIVADAIAAQGCNAVVVNGFSNGAAFAAKLYCQGEDFDGVLRGVVIDDPVPDNAVIDCTPSADVAAALYWTGGLDDTATPGADCGAVDWTCEGDTMIGIDAYATGLAVPITSSPNSDHEWFWDAPEIRQFLS